MGDQPTSPVPALSSRIRAHLWPRQTTAAAGASPATASLAGKALYGGTSEVTVKFSASVFDVAGVCVRARMMQESAASCPVWSYHTGGHGR